MPRNAAGNYTLPLPPVATGTTIMAATENTTDNDIATELTNSLDRNGRGGMVGAFKIADGTVSAPGMAFTQDPSNGFYRIGANDWAAAVAGAKLLELIPGKLIVGGALSFAQAQPPDGTVAAPSYSFASDPASGFFLQQGAVVGLALGGTFSYRWSTSFLSLNSGAGIAWSATGAANTAGDLALMRDTSAASTLQINNATRDAYADLKLRNLTASGSIGAAGGISAAAGIACSGGTSNFAGSVGAIAANTSTSHFQMRSGGSTSDAAYMSFYRVAGSYAAHFGLDTDNNWKVGGWSMGAASYKILHEGNSFTVDTIGNLGFAKILTISAAGNIINYGATNLTNVSCVTINASSNIVAGDVYANRGVSSGCLFLGSNGSYYLYNDGARWDLAGMPLVVLTPSFGVGIAAGANPVCTLSVRVASGVNLFANASGANGILGYGNDALSAWLPFYFQATGSVAPLGDNTTTCGKTGNRWSVVWAATSTISTSDARLKKNVVDSPLGLAFIDGLRPVSYQWINGGNILTRVPDYEEPVAAYTTIDGEVVPATTRTIYRDEYTPTEGKRTHFGLIAQEVRQALTAAGAVDFGGFIQANASDPESELGLRYEEFIGPLIKAVQELSARVQALEALPA